MPSPIRRSARGALPGKPPPPASTASSSSLSSNRQERGPSNGTKQKSVTPHSLSSEDASEPPRRSQRSHPVKRSDGDKDARPDDVNDDEEEEEVTRCVCGHQEYPGPPQSIAFTEAELQSEDAGGLFISCDGCSVWQHGGCVGIVEDSQAPDKYYCEECRPKLHDLHADSRGQQYSLYVPLHPKPSRKQSISKHGDKAQKEREVLMPSRMSADPATGRRRATMRSKEHDDEEEQFLRAIEESKREVEPDTVGRKSGKRSREESEENKHDIKRQRTASDSLPSVPRIASREDESDAEAGPPAARHKKSRAEAVQSARQAEVREKEKEREKARAEAAGRRQERAGRRRADEPEEDETSKPSSGEKMSPPPSSLPGSPLPEAEAEKTVLKKGPGRRMKKLGNNQYTRQRDSSHPTASSPHSKKRIPTSNTIASSGDEQPGHGEGSNGGPKNSPALEGNGNGRGKFGKGRGRAAQANGLRHAIPLDISELTIPEMARQITAMAAFMARAQPDLLGERTPSMSGIQEQGADEKTRGGRSQLARSIDGSVEELQHISLDGRKFEELNAAEMADLLSRNMAFWETKFVAPSPSS